MAASGELAVRKFVAPEILFGIGAGSFAGQYARNYGATKVLLVTDDGVIRAGWVEPVTRSLSEAGIGFTVFAGLTPNPKTDEVMAGVEAYESEECDVIVSVGGGSPIDCAKGIGIVSSNSRDILDLRGIDNIDIPGPPLISIPTTWSGADLSQFAIITNRAQRTKDAIISKALVPDVSLTDPSATMTMPRDLTANLCFDVLTHGIESCVSTVSSIFTDMYALKAIELLSHNLIPALQDPGNLDLRIELTAGAIYAGLAFSNASLGAAHALSHSIGGMYDSAHGQTNAILIDHVVKFNYDAVPHRYENISKAMGLDLAGMSDREKKEALLNAIGSLKREAGIPLTLKQAGVKRADIPLLAKKAMKDVCLATNPRQVTVTDVEAIYEEAL